MSVLWHYGVETGRLSPEQFVALTSTNAARIFGLYPRKGTIVPGADADLVLWDRHMERKISASTHHQNVDYNLYEGMNLRGAARTTIANSRIVWHEGDLRAVKGKGRYLPRKIFTRSALG